MFFNKVSSLDSGNTGSCCGAQLLGGGETESPVSASGQLPGRGGSTFLHQCKLRTFKLGTWWGEWLEHTAFFPRPPFVPPTLPLFLRFLISLENPVDHTAIINLTLGVMLKSFKALAKAQKKLLDHNHSKLECSV